ncbi:MAG: DNA polymerase III subunit beta [Patescibacteria group bacterium]|nr:DNA polymerase III subunit beta [Patescibacteria group bacterium]
MSDTFFSIKKDLFLNFLEKSTYFCSGKGLINQVLQGVLIKGERNIIHFYSSNLNSFYHGEIKINEKIEKKFEVLIEPRKIIEFLNYLPKEKINLSVLDKQIIIFQDKTQGTFPLIKYDDFPLPPIKKTEEQKIKTNFLKNNLLKILFSTAKDENRPVLTGVNFTSNEDFLIMVTTDGFRLSLIKAEKQIKIPNLIIPSLFLETVIRLIKEETVFFYYLDEEKMVVFKTKEDEFYSRIIEGEFPPFEKVIPEKTNTQTTVSKDDFFRAIKIISVFAKDMANIVILEIKKDQLIIKPKTGEEQNTTTIESKTEGEEQKIAFNFRFLLDFLNNIDEKEIIIEVNKPEAPVIFKTKNKNYLHLIMPIRLQTNEE